MRARGDNRKNAFSVLAPFALALIILVLVLRFAFGGSNTQEVKTGSSLNIQAKEGSEAYVYMSGDSKKQISGSAKLFDTDNKLEVKVGEAEAVFDGNTPGKIYLDKGAEVRYGGIKDGKENIYLDNSYLWLEGANDKIQITLGNFELHPEAEAVVIVNQNAIAGNAYVLRGSVTVKAMGSFVTVGVGQQITLLKNEMKEGMNLRDKVQPIDDFIRQIDFFLRHNGDTVLASASLHTGSGTAANGSGSIFTEGSGSVRRSEKKIVILSPEDESTLETNKVTIEGKIMDTNVRKVTINERDASINPEENTFILKDVSLPSASNNLVYKAFDAEGAQIMKGVVTVYVSKKAQTEQENKPTVTTFPISDKDFSIMAPKENPYKTTDNVVRIEGRVNKGAVKYITINDFRLSKFPQFSTYWYYYANKDFGTMNDGINLYSIKYYGEDDTLLSTQLFTIVKEAKEEEVAPIEPEVTPTVKPSEKPATQSGSTPVSTEKTGNVPTGENASEATEKKPL